MRASRWLPAMLVLLSPLGANVHAATLRWPVRVPGRAAPAGPSYAGDRLEVRLAPWAAAVARDQRPSGATRGAARLSRLGLPALEHTAAAAGARFFEPEFVGESAPADVGAADFTAYYVVHLAPEADLASALDALRALPEIASAEPIGVLPLSAVPNDSLWSGASWFYQPSRADVHAPEAWDVTTGDTSIVVAVLDTGVLPYHPDLGGSVAGLGGQMWVNREEKAGVTFLDDDGNGFVDDVSGWDFVALPDSTDIFSGEDWRDADNDPNDFSGHGTFVAGLIGALTDNTIGVSGMDWNVRIMPLRVAYSTQSDPGGLVDMSFVAQAVRYATRNGASVINASFATLDLSGLSAAVAAATRAGVTVVFAAGNFGQPQDVGSREDVIEVAATDAFDQIAGFSNLSPTVDLAAPGTDMTSTYVVHSGPDSLAARQPAYLAGFNGTSFSAPLVSGAAALLQAQRKAAGRRPLYPTGVLLRLRETADDIRALNGSLTGYGTGRLNVARALLDPPGGMAIRAGALAVGPAVVLPSTSGHTVVAQAFANQRVLFFDGASGDTLRLATLPGAPAGNLAAADLGGGQGVALFIGTQTGRVASFDRSGNARPGWPVTGPGGPYGMVGGMALGDLDGDGALEVVAGAADGSVYAWEGDGTPRDGFPVALTPFGINVPVALGPLDGSSSAEIVAAGSDGSLHALDGAGGERPGWPVSLSGTLTAPVITTWGGQPAIVVGAGDSLFAFGADGGRRFAVGMGGLSLQDLALGDVAAQHSDDVVASLETPSAIAVFDSTGAPPGALTWPQPVTGAAFGPPVLGGLHAGGASDVIAMRQGGLVAFTPQRAAIDRFPEPGLAGGQPTLADLDGTGSTRVVAGTGPDSVLYIYSAGPGSWNPAAPWPTPRGNFARTGNRAYAPALTPLDDSAPSAIADLSVGFVPPDSIRLTWTAPGNDGAAGRASAYQLHVTGRRDDARRFTGGGLRTDLPAPDSASAPESATLGGLAANTTLFFCLRARDAAGNSGAPSNVVGMLTPLGPPLGVGPPEALAARGQPSRLPVEFDWSARAGAEKTLEVFDLAGRRVRRFALPAAEVRGRLAWDGRDEAGQRVAAGLFFARLTSGGRRVAARVVVAP